MNKNFLQRILPSLPPTSGSLTPCYYMVGIKPGGYIRQVPFNIVEDGYRIADSMQGMNVYIALSAFKDEAFGRKAVNSCRVKCLWADIDVGKEKNSYATQEEAIAALQKFTLDTGLKPSILVGSGAGFAAYWVFDKDVDTSKWKVMARMFAALCQQEGFVIDPACTEDAARVMRMPGTVHQKTGNIASVLIDKGRSWSPKELFLQIAGKLKNADTYLQNTQPAAPAAPSQTTTVMQTAFPDLGPQPPKGDAENIVRQCGQVLVAGMLTEPHWYAALGVLKRCPNGREWAHVISAMDKTRYNAADTDQKFDRAPDDKPSSCTYLSKFRPDICQKCPHRGSITTPAQLSTVPFPKESEPAKPVKRAEHLVIPDKYEYQPMAVQDSAFSVDDRGILYTYVDKSDTGDLVSTTKVICTSQLYYLYSVCEYVDKAPQLTHWFQVVHATGRKLKVPFVISRDMSLQCIMRWFNNAGMIPTGRAYKPQLFLDFMNAYLRNITARGRELPTIKKFGWTKFEDPVVNVEVEGFATGSGMITESGIHDINFGDIASSIAENEMTHRGNLEQWKKVPQMYKTLNQKAAQLAVCLAFAAPLMRYGAGTANSGVFSLWSPRSGRGKTQVIRACAGIWGDPDAQIIQRNSSTVLRMRKLAALNNLPCFMDELTDVPDEDMYSLAYTLVDGREKQKLKSSGDKMVETGTWKTMTFTTANKSFKAAAAKIAGDSEASLLRVMEIECDFASYEDNPEVHEYIQNCIDTCRDNFGLAGPEFMYQLMQNHADRLATLTRQCEHWCVKYKFSNAERFIAYPLALAIKCGRWAVEFGLLDYDMDALEAWAVNEFMSHNRQATETHRVHHDEALRNFFLDRQSNTLVVVAKDRPESMKETPRGMPDPYIINCPNQNIYIRKELADNKIYVAATSLLEWCRRQNMSLQVLISEVRKCGIDVGTEGKSLGDGIEWLALAPVQCFTFKISDVEPQVNVQ